MNWRIIRSFRRPIADSKIQSDHHKCVIHTGSIMNIVPVQVYPHIRDMKKPGRQNRYRCFHLDPQQMSRHHGILPAAYKIHYEETYKEKKIRKKGKRKSRSIKNRDRQIPNNEGKSAHGINNDTEKRIARLLSIEDDVAVMLKCYEKELGTSIVCKERKMVVDDIVDWDGSQLVHTEKIYRKTALKLRQLVVGWSWIRPLPHKHNLKSDEDQINNMPFSKAHKYLELLESVRNRRSDLIDAGSTTTDVHRKNLPLQSYPGVIRWLTDKFTEIGQHETRSLEDDPLNNLNELKSHVSQDYTANERLYDAVLNSYGQWCDNMSRSKLEHQMELILENMKENFDRGNPNVKPDCQIYHRLMKIYQNSASLDSARKSVSLLNQMHETSRKEAEKGETLSCQPTSFTYKLVISCFHGIGSDVNMKLKAISLADDVLLSMENDSIFLESEAKTNNILGDCIGFDFDHTCDPYHTMLLNLIAAGPKGLPDYLDRIDNLIERVMGRSAYKSFMSNDEILIDTSVIHHLFVADLIYAFSLSGQRAALEKAKILLKKMENTRKTVLEGKHSSDISWNIKYPLANSFNSVIIGLLYSTFDGEKSDSTSTLQISKVSDAAYATDLLDSILERGSSKRDAYTYYRLIRLWGATDCREAGRRGEEILNRLEISMAINAERDSLKDIALRSKQSALECYSTAAAAGEPGAARSALQLLNRLERRIAYDINYDDKGRREKGFFYMAVIRACADTCTNGDKADALEIAFEMYNRMLEEDIPLTPYTFVQLLKCCQLVDPSAYGQALKLSREIFQAACFHGVVSRYVLFSLKNVNAPLFEAYSRKPEHSINLKKMPLE